MAIGFHKKQSVLKMFIFANADGYKENADGYKEIVLEI